MKTVVIARAGEGGEELQAAINALGFHVLNAPVLRIEDIPAHVPDNGSDMPLVFTSANAVRAFAKITARRDNPVFTVGPNTAYEAQRAGFTDTRTSAGTVEDLALLLSEQHGGPHKDVLYVRGEDVARDLKNLLAKGSVGCCELTVYRSVPADNLSVELLRALDQKDIAAILFFSPRGGTAFSNLIEQYGRASRTRTTKALCISEAVLQSVSVLPFGGTFVADTPDRYGMIKLLEHLRD